MEIDVDRTLGVRWPWPIGPKGRLVFEDLVGRLDGVNWFVMGRTFLQLTRNGELDTTDSDIDFGVHVDDFPLVRERLADWPFAIQTKHRNKVQQAMWYPNEVLVDCHVFHPTVSYISMRGRFATRRTTVFDTEQVDTPYGKVRVPGMPERYLIDDYGQDWRQVVLKSKRK